MSSGEQLQRAQSHQQQLLSSPNREQLRAWRLFFESATALLDVLETSFEQDTGLTIQYYDTLVHLEDAPDGLRMSELAEKIMYSKSGLTRVVDRMEKAGLVSRHRPENDRRSVFVLQTAEGRKAMEHARPIHHAWIRQNFSSLLSDTDIAAVTRVFGKVSQHARTHRPGRGNE
jgi:DNA-binding MarR family transcriptional regulator